MGAYFQTQFAKQKDGEKIAFVGSGFKFLEGFYAENYTNNGIYFYLAKNAPLYMATVCDYDKDPDWAWDEYAKRLGKSYLPKTLEDCLRKGVFINLDKKSYIDLGKIFDSLENTLKEVAKKRKTSIDEVRNDLDYWLVCPLALLTRKENSTMGSGDFHDDKLSDFTLSFISDWHGNLIDYKETLPEEYQNFTDLSSFMVVCEKDCY